MKNGQKRLTTVKTRQYGPNWFLKIKMVNNGKKWSNMVKIGQNWSKTVKNGQKQSKTGLNGQKRSKLSKTVKTVNNGQKH